MKNKYLKLALVIQCAALVMLLGLSACTSPQVITNPDGSTSTNHVVDPRLETGITAARAGNAASAPFNPFASLVDVALSAVTAGALWVAKRKNDKSAADQLLLKTVIQAIDALDDTKVKEAIQGHATRVGVEGELQTAVKKVGSGII